MRNIALDLGSRKIFCSVAKDGVVVDRKSAASLQGLRSVVGPDTPAARVAVEACREAWAVCDQLTAWGHDPVLVDTTRSRAMGIGRHGRKTDRIDADVLSLALDANRIPRAHLLSTARRELRGLLGVRGLLVETATKLINGIRGYARAAGEVIPTVDSAAFLKKLSAVKLSEKLKELIGPLLSVLALTQSKICDLDEKLEATVRGDSDLMRLTTVPGVGPVTAATFVSVIDDAGRFKNGHQVMSYLGLVPSENTTGGNRRLGGISKAGNCNARTALVEAAHVLLCSGKADPLRAWGLRIQKKHNRRHAAVCVARKLCGILWAMLVDGSAYDPTMVGTSSAEGLRRRALDTEREAVAMERATIKAANRKRHHAWRRRNSEEACATYPGNLEAPLEPVAKALERVDTAIKLPRPRSTPPASSEGGAGKAKPPIATAKSPSRRSAA